jgi:homogentisate 1,2-dioxygenase
MADDGRVQPIREFMTTWDGSPRPPLEAWSDRNKANLMGSTKSTRFIPLFRAFDLLSMPNQALVILANDDHRIGVESVVGAQEHFHRWVDADVVYFQYCGATTLETEFGDYEMRPGELMFVPEGIAHRSTGTADSLRWFAIAHEPFTDFFDETRYTSHTEFEVVRKGGPGWTVPAGRERARRGGKVTEAMHCWDDRPDDLTIAERDYEYLVGASSTQVREKVSGIRKIRAFDFFTEIVGKKGGSPPLFKGPNLEIKTYNIVGEQFAFHRALRSEEIRIQFRGNAMDMSEFENVPIQPGEVTIIPRGIAHSVVTVPPESRDFLRLNFYSAKPWRIETDLTRHAHHSTFEIRTVVRREAAWRQAAE